MKKVVIFFTFEGCDGLADRGAVVDIRGGIRS